MRYIYLLYILLLLKGRNEREYEALLILQPQSPIRTILIKYILSEAVAKCYFCAELKSILRVGPKVKDSIEDPFK
jgi:hypothetical protein